MFILAGKYEFPADPEQCWLSAGIGYQGRSNGNPFWNLHLSSKSVPARFPQFVIGEQIVQADEQLTDYASFGIDVHPAFDVGDWKELAGQTVTMPADALDCGFNFHAFMGSQWEDLTALELHFGEAHANQIELSAEGRGLVEAWPEIFPEGEVSFSIRTRARFNGVAVNVPLNVPDATSYAQSRARDFLPRCAFGKPQLRKTDLDGKLRALEVLFPPA